MCGTALGLSEFYSVPRICLWTHKSSYRSHLYSSMSSRDKEGTTCWFFRAGWQGLRRFWGLGFQSS